MKVSELISRAHSVFAPNFEKRRSNPGKAGKILTCLLFLIRGKEQIHEQESCSYYGV